MRIELLKVGDLAFKVALMLFFADHEDQREDRQIEIIDDIFGKIAAGVGCDFECHLFETFRVREQFGPNWRYALV